jgi:hypothetical protein
VVYFARETLPENKKYQHRQQIPWGQVVHPMAEPNRAETTLPVYSRLAIIIFAATIALIELGVVHLLVTTAFNIILGGVCLALALAFGLGGKDAVARYIEELKEKGKITRLEKE